MKLKYKFWLKSGNIIEFIRTVDTNGKSEQGRLEEEIGNLRLGLRLRMHGMIYKQDDGSIIDIRVNGIEAYHITLAE